jgi:hypothetical protein
MITDDFAPTQIQAKCVQFLQQELKLDLIHMVFLTLLIHERISNQPHLHGDKKLESQIFEL